MDTNNQQILTFSQIRQAVTEIAKSKDYIDSVYLFGSYARNEATINSDIDIHVVFNRNVGLRSFELDAELEDIFGKQIDVVFNDEFNKLIYGNTKKERLLLYSKESVDNEQRDGQILQSCQNV